MTVTKDCWGEPMRRLHSEISHENVKSEFRIGCKASNWRDIMHHISGVSYKTRDLLTFHKLFLGFRFSRH
jgi:hypothetical protein